MKEPSTATSPLPRLARLYDLDRFADLLDADALSAECRRREDGLYRDNWREVIELLHGLPTRQALEQRGPLDIDTSGAVLRLGSAGLFTKSEQERFDRLLRALMPWRKGPFELFGVEIDAEWRSDKKWDRISPMLGDLEGALIADIGCGNGYYMLRLAELNPASVIGFDPSEQFWFTFALLQRYLSDPRLQYQLLGVEDVQRYPQFFDLVLCMGIIYHQREPLTMLRRVYDCLSPGGRMILEGLTIPGDEPVALCVAGRFAQMRNVYYVPTAAGLAAWAEKTGFVNVSVFSEVELTSEEQRKTEYGSVQSLEDYLDPQDPSRTVEGHPAPLRAALIAEKPA